jgi:pyruvate-formate lyase
MSSSCDGGDENYPDIKVYPDPQNPGKTIVDIKLYKDPMPMPLHLQPVSSGQLERIQNLTSILDGYFDNNGQHINVNVLTREMLADALEHPDLYGSFCVRISGYAISWSRLTQEQRIEFVNRTLHETL